MRGPFPKAWILERPVSQRATIWRSLAVGSIFPTQLRSPTVNQPPPHALPTDDQIMAKRPFEFALGRLVMNFGALEYSLISGIAELLPFLPESILTKEADTSFGPALTTYSGFVRQLINDPVLLNGHKSLMAHLRVLKNKRNECIHGAWFDVPGRNIDAEKAKLARHAKLGDLVSPAQHAGFITPAMIVDLFNEVYVACRRLDAHRAAILAAIGKPAVPVQSKAPSP